ncbi:MAG: TrkH family potassium uptake protein [Methanobacteriota archaeon]|nr:MAG: TrkH family potassium uptake protein [Euryarchaeota archaeon]
MRNGGHPDLRIILQSLGMVFIVIGILAVAPLLVAAYYNEALAPFFLVSVLPLVLGISTVTLLKEEAELQVKHATIAAALTYLLAALLGSLPFMYYGMGFLDSFFEAMSGWTTTGLTMIADVEAMPRSILFWRSYMQWLGGIGVIVLMLVVLAGAGTAASKLYQAEARKDRLKPRLLTTVRLIWWIYLLYTLAGILLYYLAGMGVFDAVNHTMAALSTGGFSTKNANIQGFNSLGIEIVSIFLMLLGATNFLVHYKVLTGQRGAFLRDMEARTLYAIAIAGGLALSLKIPGLRHSIFQSVSSLTTTGFSSIDFAQLDSFSKLVMSFLMMIGASTGSTGGAIKIMRLVIVVYLILWWVQKTLLPEHAVITKNIGGAEFSDQDLQETVVFFLLYLFIFSFGVLVFVYLGYPAIDSIFEVASAQGDVGLSVGLTRTALHPLGKLLLIFDMWIGRLEIIPVLVLAQALLGFRPRLLKSREEQGW